MSENPDDPEARHCHDPQLARALTRVITAGTVVDFGCGEGNYVRAALDRGIDCCGYDGNPNTPRLSRGLCAVLDLSQRFDLNRKFDWVMSLEVGEHIPAQWEATFIDNLARHAVEGIVVSWAIPGQAGDGHVNCKSNADVVAAFEVHGLTLDRAASDYLRARAHRPWFHNTLLVLRRTPPTALQTLSMKLRTNRLWMFALRLTQAAERRLY